MTEHPFNMDAYAPAEMAARVETVGVAKANLDAATMFALAVLGGAFIALGANLATVLLTGHGLGYGVSRVAAGLVFSLGLMLVIVGGAELFTGNSLMVMAWASGKVSAGRVLRNWLIVYAGNFTGALATAVGIYLSRQWAFDAHQVGATAVAVAVAKVSHGMLPAFVLGVFGNALVCLAVWLCVSARTTTDKILAIVPPITAFVAAGFEHSVANMYFIPMALFLRGEAHVLERVGPAVEPLARLTWGGFFLDNLIPVTLGNLVGGGVMVAAVYWCVYLRARPGNRVVRTWRHLARARAEAGRAAHDPGETP
jgi:formate/nitrite transporter